MTDQTPPDDDASRGRWLALGALCLAALALAAVWLTRDTTTTYKFVFENAGQLVKGDVARVGGVRAGNITAIELTDDGQAEVTVELDRDYAPLHGGTTAVIRMQGLVGTANRYVDISPGPNFESKLDEGARISADNTVAVVELDQLFNTFDRRTRKGLEDFIKGQASWYAGNEERANRSAHYFSTGLNAITRLVKDVNRDSAAFQAFIVETSEALGAIAERRTELTDLVGNAGETARALSADGAALNRALANLPGAFEQGSETFEALRPALGDLQRLAVASRPATRDLGPFMEQLAPVLRRAQPTFRDFRLLFSQPGQADDLLDALEDLPELARLSEKAFPRARESLREGTEIFSFIRPYLPDFVAWLRGFGHALAPYDANGHYARAMAVFDAFTFVDDAEGGRLEAKGAAGRGHSAYLSRGNLRRCPGAAAAAPADGSAPFVDTGELANADCEPGHGVGMSP